MALEASPHHSLQPNSQAQPEQDNQTVADDGHWSYETSVLEIEKIITHLENGELPLAEVLENFQDAVAELARCEKFLQDKQGQVTLMIQTLEPLPPKSDP